MHITHQRIIKDITHQRIGDETVQTVNISCAGDFLSVLSSVLGINMILGEFVKH